MNFTLSKRVLPAVALVTAIISNQGISALDMLDMNMNMSPEKKKKQSSSSSASGGVRRGLSKPSKERKDHFTRIVGGSPVEAGEYPWFARATLTFFGFELWYGCGGSLVTEEFVLSAAHCGWTTSGVGMQIGALCPPYGPSSGQNCGQDVEEFDVVQVIDHPQYNAFSSDKDYSLLKLSGKSTIAPVPMDSTGVSLTYPNGKLLTPIGFGTTSSGGDSSDILLDVDSPYVDNQICDDLYGFFGPITNAMMCAGDTVNGGVDACQGDSGGPLYDKDGDLLVGITSWGIGCADADFPGVYARVSDQWEWISTNICNNHSNPKPCFCDDSCTDTDDEPPTTDDEPPTTDDGGTTDDDTTCPAGEDLLTFTLTTDNYGQDITWAIAIKSGGYSLYEGPFGKAIGEPYDDNETFVEELCLANDNCYKFVINDYFQDGLCCEWGEGGYTLEWNGDVINTSQFNNGEFEFTDFGDC